MATRLAMPKLGMIMTQGTLTKWLKTEGEPVEKGEAVFRLMTDKINYEVEAPDSGRLHQVVAERQTVPVGATVGYLLLPEEAVPPGEGPVPQLTVAPAPAVTSATSVTVPKVPTAEPGFVRASPAARRLAQEHNIDLSTVKGTGPEGRITEADVRLRVEQEAQKRKVPISPLARSLAGELRIDVTAIEGTGPGGHIMVEDVRKAVEGEAAVSPAIAPGVRLQAGQVLPFDGVRRVIADRMAGSLQSMAQLTITAEADVTDLVKLRTQLVEEWGPEGIRVGYTDLVIKAVAKALKEHPRLNSTLVGEQIHLLTQVNVGMAIALEDGLIVPVVLNADQRNVKDIAHLTKELTEKARSANLTPDEITGGTFTITTLGMFDVQMFTPIVNPPEVAILGVGAITERPAVFEGNIVKRSLMYLSLSFDHRIVDGAQAAEFLRRVKYYLERPYLLLT